MASLDVGDERRFTATFTDATTSSATNPSAVTFVFIKPDGTSEKFIYGTDAEVIRPSTGNYYVDYVLDQAGSWTWGVASTGTSKAVEQESFQVNSSQVYAIATE